MYLKQKFMTKWQSKQFKQIVNLFTCKINVIIEFAVVLLSVWWEASEASKKFLKHKVLFVALLNKSDNEV